MTEPAPAQGMSVTRKLIHVAMSMGPAIGWYWSFPLVLVLAGLFMLASLVLEAARRWWPAVNHLLWRAFPTTFRQGEARRVLGSTWFAVGILPTLLFYGSDVGGTAMLFLAWGDPAAEFVGRRWGKPGGGKTLAGSLGCLFACLVAGVAGVSLGGLSPWTVLAGAVVATAVERWSPPPDDNVWMPLLSGLAMLAIQRLVFG